MNYKLTKQLKDSGYKGEFNLSSLIDACGNNIDVIERNRGEWHTDNGEMDNDKYIEAWGKTPEEAVAKLWLKLHS